MLRSVKLDRNTTAVDRSSPAAIRCFVFLVSYLFDFFFFFSMETKRGVKKIAIRSIACRYTFSGLKSLLVLCNFFILYHTRGNSAAFLTVVAVYVVFCLFLDDDAPHVHVRTGRYFVFVAHCYFCSLCSLLCLLSPLWTWKHSFHTSRLFVCSCVCVCSRLCVHVFTGRPKCCTRR